MRILFIGGTGLISSACSAASVSAGHELWLLNRGYSKLPTPVAKERLLTADAADEEQVKVAVAGLEFDVVVNGSATDRTRSKRTSGCSPEPASTCSSPRRPCTRNRPRTG